MCCKLRNMAATSVKLTGGSTASTGWLVQCLRVNSGVWCCYSTVCWLRITAVVSLPLQWSRDLFQHIIWVTFYLHVRVQCTIVILHSQPVQCSILIQFSLVYNYVYAYWFVSKYEQTVLVGGNSCFLFKTVWKAWTCDWISVIQIQTNILFLMNEYFKIRMN